MSEEDDVTGHTSRPAGNGEQTRAYFTRWIQGVEELAKERDRRYEEREKDADRRYSEKFTSLEKEVASAFAASEKAIDKADVATEKRFDAVNEFRGTLADQASNLIPRSEADQRFKSIEETMRRLEVWQGERSGSHAQEASGRNQGNWLTGVIVGATLGGLALLVSVANVAYGMASK